MKRVLFSFVAIAASVSMSIAQTIEEGVKAIYYSKYNNARDIFQQIVNREPENTEATYWLGQTLLQNLALTDGLQQANALYQKVAATKPNDPWVLVGLGNIDYLLHNDKNAAKQKFEKAIAEVNDKVRRRQRNAVLAEIYTAIGRASSQGNGEQGDPNFVIPLLEKALEFNTTSPYPGIYLGMNYLKLGGENGGKAYQAYDAAARRDPNFALAPYRIGVMYQSQSNFTAMNEWYQKAIIADPNFPAPYLTYFEYFREHDVNKAKEFLDQFVKVAEQSCHTKYFQADFSYVSGKYQDAIDQAAQNLNTECRDYPDFNLLMAKCYHRLGQGENAATAVDRYFKMAPPASIPAFDYASAGYILKEVSGREAEAIKHLQKAFKMDTVPYNREKYIDSIAYSYDKINKPIEKLNWLKDLFKDKPVLTDKNLVALADAAFKADDYPLTDSLYTILKGKYPNDQFAYYYLQQSALMQDSTLEKAYPHIMEYSNFLEKNNVDKQHDKTLLYEYSLLGSYFANTKKDYPSARIYFQKIVEIDPTNQTAQDAIVQLNAIINDQPTDPAKSGNGKSGTKTKSKGKGK